MILKVENYKNNSNYSIEIVYLQNLIEKISKRIKTTLFNLV